MNLDELERLDAELNRVCATSEAKGGALDDLLFALYTNLPDLLALARDGERWRKYLELYDSEELTAAEWAGPEAITAFIDAMKERT